MSIQEGSIGIIIEYTVFEDDGVTPKNISSATTHNLVLKKPDQSVVNHAAIFSTDGTDGKIRFTTTLATDLTPAGAYRIQADLTMPGFDGRTGSDVFHVERNL